MDHVTIAELIVAPHLDLSKPLDDELWVAFIIFDWTLLAVEL